jgi:hypothetical protein
MGRWQNHRKKPDFAPRPGRFRASRSDRTSAPGRCERPGSLVPVPKEWLNNNVGMLDATVAAVSTTGGSEPVWRCAAGRRHGGYQMT